MAALQKSCTVHYHVGPLARELGWSYALLYKILSTLLSFTRPALKSGNHCLCNAAVTALWSLCSLRDAVSIFANTSSKAPFGDTRTRRVFKNVAASSNVIP